MSKREKILIVVLAVCLVGLAGQVAYPYAKKKIVKTNSPAPVTQKEAEPVVIKDTEADTAPVDQGVTWLSSPKEIENLHLIKKADDFDCDTENPTYYKTADLADGGEIILLKTTCGMGADYYIRFKKEKAGKYSLLTKHTNAILPADRASILVDYSTKTSLDTTTAYIGLTNPDVVATTNGAQFRQSGSSGKKIGGSYFFSEIYNPVKVADTSYGTIYKELDPKAGDASVQIRYLYLKHADGTATPYDLPVTIMSDDQVPNVTINGVKNTTKYFTSVVAGKCGGLGARSIIVDTSDISSRLEAAGEANTGDKIYYLKNNNDPVNKVAYESYKIGRENDLLNFDQFAAKKPVFIWKNQIGEYITLFSQDYAPNAECGKPVVYLYPEKKTDVSVRVDVNITKSEPDYGKGWNVTAYPTGKLLLDGKEYSYLFWEGIGKVYPGVDKGFVVKSTGVKGKIEEDLIKLGLNQKERNDFMEFWLPKMPKTPYVRLTWFGTNEMEQLAPLSVDPKPDTIIRVFLDFEGLNEPAKIQPQTLKSIPRKGFTVVEWGGLLNNVLK